MLVFEEENLTMEQVLEKTNELIAAYTKADQDMEKSILAMVEASKQQHLSVQQMQEFNDILTETDVNGMIPSVSSEDESSGSTEEDEEYIPVESVEKIPLWESTDVTQMASLDTKIVNVRKNILTVKVPKRMQDNIATGHLYVDRLMAGDGVTPSTACLVTGIAGSGKTSMLIQVADAIMGSGNIAIYNSNEESSVQVSRVVNRLRLKNGFEFTEYENVFDLIKHVKKVQEQAYEEYSEMFDRMKENGASGYRLSKLKPKQVFLFVDSLQTMQMPHWVYDANLDIVHDMKGEPLKKIGRSPQGDNMHLMIARYLTEWCKKTYGICFIIGQVTKDGEFAGKSGIKHWVDAHMHLDIDRDRKSKTYNERIAEMTKNRFGSSGVYYSFEITSRGLVFKNPDKPV